MQFFFQQFRFQEAVQFSKRSFNTSDNSMKICFSVNDSRPFNEFEMYDEGTNFGTFHLEYHKYNFDQLKELMYFNVTSHIEVSKLIKW